MKLKKLQKKSLQLKKAVAAAEANKISPLKKNCPQKGNSFLWFDLCKNIDKIVKIFDTNYQIIIILFHY